LRSLARLKYQEIITGLIVFFALMIAFWIPLYKYLIYIFITTWLVLTFFEGKFKRNFSTQYKNENLFFFSIQIVFFLIICLGIIISDSKEIAIEIVYMKLSFLLFPILFLLHSDKLIKYKDLVLKVFILGNLIASVICIVYAFIQSIDIIGNDVYFYNQDIRNNNYFRYNLFSVFHHPSYFSMYLLLSMASLFYLRRKADKLILALGTFLFYSLIFYHILIIYFLSSRAGMLIVLVLIIREFFLYIKRRKNVLIKVLSIVVLIVGIYLILNNNRFKIALQSSIELIEEGKANENYPVRLLLWESAVDLIKDNFWIGIGTGDSKSEFSEKNKSLNYKDQRINNYNAHNQFLETFMSSGFIGIFVLLTIFIAGFVRGIKKKDELFLIFLSIVLLNFLVESMLNTIAGIIFIVYFYNYFVFVDQQKMTLPG
jgi:O-antigen ligase